ncbi:aldehyde dehydrogenase family protein [Serratia ureilytica]
MKLNNPGVLRSQCLINGEWCDALSGKREAVINPATGAELASIPLVSEEETQQAIAAAQRAQKRLEQLTAKQRSALLLAWADRCWPHRKIWRQLMTAEQGKSLAARAAKWPTPRRSSPGSPKRPSGWTARYCRRRRLRSAWW